MASALRCTYAKRHSTAKQLLNATGTFQRFTDALYLYPPAFVIDMMLTNETNSDNDRIIVENMHTSLQIYFVTKQLLKDYPKTVCVSKN